MARRPAPISAAQRLVKFRRHEAAGISFRERTTTAVGEHGIPEKLDRAAGAAAVAAFRGRVTSGEIGFPDLPDDRGTAHAIEEFARTARRGLEDVLVLGIGGSALGAYALDAARRGPH